MKFDQMRENNPSAKKDSQESPSRAFDEFYTEESNARSLCLVWNTGRRIFLSYSYLISAEYEPDESIITLVFTSHTFILKGVNLEGLFYAIMQHSIKQITCTDERYNLVGDEERFTVNEIIEKPQQSK